MLPLDTTFHGYRILAFLGAGGAGSVYRAVQEGLDREVALKVVRPGGKSGSDERKRFLREARALARLAHPNIVRIYDFGEDESHVYYSMEFVAGRSLDKKLLEGGPLARDEALRVTGQLLDALETVHDLGVLHRDIKPANVLLGPDGSILLSDFGLAREKEATRMTREGTLMGTLPYFPPEMVRLADTDARGDLYQAAVMLYELTMGSVPYTSEELLGLLRGGPLDTAPALERVMARHDPALANFLRQGMEPDPTARFQTAREMKHALGLVMSPSQRRHLARTRVSAPRPVNAPTVTAPVRARRRPWLAWTAAACFLLAFAMALRISLHRPAPVSVSKEPPAPVNPKYTPQRVQAMETWRGRILAQRELELTRISPALYEVCLVAAGEIEWAAVKPRRNAARTVLREVNGRVLPPGERGVPPETLVDGNNRFVFEAAERPVLHLRRRPNASLTFPKRESVPPSPAASQVAALIDKAKADFGSGRYNDALRACEQAAAIDPRSWEAAWKKAVALHYITYVTRGLRAAGAGLELLSPSDEDPETIRRQTFEFFGTALEIQPAESNIWYDLGCAYRDFRRREDCERALAMANVIDPTHHRYWWELGRTLAERVPSGQERTSGAMQLAFQAFDAGFSEGDPPKTTWLLDRGTFYRRAGKLAEARRDFESVLAREPNNRRARQELAGLPK